MHAINPSEHERFLSELEHLDDSSIVVDGKEMRPSQCYHIGLDPVHVLFNENCPEPLRERINEILKKFRYT